MAGLAGAAAFPLAAQAQPAGTPVIGVLSPQSAGPTTASRMAGFLQGLSELKFVPGRNVAIEYRWADGNYDRLRPLADELVGLKVAVIAATTQDAAIAAKAATSTIPIVFNIGGDPVRSGLVASMNRPGGNATGISMFSSELEAKRFGLLQEMAPGHRTAALLLNPNHADSDEQLRQLQSAARGLGMKLRVEHASNDAEIDAAFENFLQGGVKMLLAAADPFLASRREKLVALAAKYRIPAMWEWPDFVEGGGLMSYGTNIADNYRQVGNYTGRVLKGEKPSQLPVMRPVKFELAINLKTAKTLGLEVPPNILARADNVIE